MNLPFLKTPRGEDPIILESEFSVPAERLFKAWTIPDDIKQWFGADAGGPESAMVDLKEGGIWEFTFMEKDGETSSLSGRYLHIEQNKLLEFTWVHILKRSDGSTKQSGESVVRVEFEDRPSGAFSRLVHEGVSAESSRNNIGGGWCSSFSKIKELLE